MNENKAGFSYWLERFKNEQKYCPECGSNNVRFVNCPSDQILYDFYCACEKCYHIQAGHNKNLEFILTGWHLEMLHQFNMLCDLVKKHESIEIIENTDPPPHNFKISQIKKVTIKEHKDIWPFIVDYGLMAKKDDGAIIFISKGTGHAVNRTAQLQGYKSMQDILLDGKFDCSKLANATLELTNNRDK